MHTCPIAIANWTELHVSGDPTLAINLNTYTVVMYIAITVMMMTSLPEVF